MQANTNGQEGKLTIPFKWKVGNVSMVAGSVHIGRENIMQDIRDKVTPWYDGAMDIDRLKAMISMARSASDRVFAKSLDTVHMIGMELQQGIKFGDSIYLEDMDTGKPMVIPHGIEDAETVTCFLLLELLSSREEKLYMTRVGNVVSNKAKAAACNAWPFPTTKSMEASKA